MQDKIETVAKAKTFIGKNTEQATLENVSAHCNYSQRQLSRIFEMVTGATLGEFLRWTRLSKSLYSLKYTDAPILDIAIEANYESQEAFTRVFKHIFGVSPGEYRKSDTNVNIAGNSHLRDIVAAESHEAANSGLFREQGVNIMHVVKPARYWISFESNKDNLPPHEYWNICDMVLESEFDKIIPAEYIIGYGAAYLTMIETKDVLRRMSWGLAIDGSYDIESLKSSDCGAFRVIESSCDIDSLNTQGSDIFTIPESKYVIFSVPKHANENHGGAIRSVWEFVDEKYKYSDYGLAWNHKAAPIYEEDHPDFGYSVWVPVKDKPNANAIKQSTNKRLTSKQQTNEQPQKMLCVVAEYIKQTIQSQMPEDFTIAPMYKNIADEATIREGIYAYNDFLHSLFDYITANADMLDIQKRTLDARDGIDFELDVSFLRNSTIILFQFGMCGELSRSGDSLMLNMAQFQKAMKKTNITKAVDYLQNLIDCGFEFHGINFDDSKLNLSKIASLEVSYPDNPAVLVGLKVMAMAQYEIVNKYTNLKIWRPYGYVEQIFLRCEYNALRVDVSEYSDIDPALILQSVTKPFSTTAQELALRLHRYFIEIGCTCEVGSENAAYRFSYYFGSKDVLLIKTSPRFGCELKINAQRIAKYSDNVENFPPSLLETITTGNGCGCNNTNPKHKKVNFTLGGEQYSKCMSMMCGANDFSVDLENITDDTAQTIEKWVALELRLN